MGVAGCGSGDHPFFSRFEGVYVNRIERTLGQITAADGTSHTLLYGEACGSVWQGNPPDTMDICWMAGGGLGTYLGLHRGRGAPWITFSSYHPGGVQFCFADGSVRTVRYGHTQWDGSSSTPFTTDWLLLQQLAGWRDGGAADASALLD
jgi:prepilin-type processing-associated H-X9-DG protein